MTTTTSNLDVAATWGTSPAVTATAETAILMVNETSSEVYYCLTGDDTPPSINDGTGPKIATVSVPEGTKGITLKNGERLWLSAPDGSGCITMIKGPA